jgi:hypothetical protein
MDRQIVIDLVEEDTAPEISFRFTGLVLSDYSTKVLNIVRSDTTKISKTVTPDGTDDEVGTVQFTTGDLIVGQHSGEFKFTDPTAGGDFRLPRKFPIIFNVRENKD